MSLIENPIGATIESTFADDLVRGVVLTDALIGTFVPNIDTTLAGNRCFLYHVIGNETGNWDVPVGGMGAVSAELLDAARRAGAEIVTGAEVTAIDPDGEVTYRRGDVEARVAGAFVLANVAPYVLDGLLRPSAMSGTGAEPKPEGAQVKVNLLLSGCPDCGTPASTRPPRSGAPSTSTSCGPSWMPPTEPPTAAPSRGRCPARSTATR